MESCDAWYHYYSSTYTSSAPPDGYYKVIIEGDTHMVYCDMSRDDGGWMLVLTSQSRDWNEARLRGPYGSLPGGVPTLVQDYSILDLAEVSKNSPIGDSFMVRDNVELRVVVCV